MNRSAPPASGFQIAFLIFAVLLLAAPADKYVFSQLAWAQQGIPVGRIMIFIFAGALLLCVPALRRICRDLLAAPVPDAKLPEVAFATVLNLLVGAGTFGGFALWWWSNGGEVSLARHVAAPTDAQQLEKALSAGGIMTALLVGGLLGPVIEELVFRGFLYRAWERQWGWFPAAAASSLVFAFMHASIYVAQFFAGLLFVCLYRRTGSLRAAIAMHSVYNVSLWFPLLGRFMLPAGRETGALHVWMPNFICLALAMVAVPAYLWLSRDGEVSRDRDTIDSGAGILRT